MVQQDLLLCCDGAVAHRARRIRSWTWEEFMIFTSFVLEVLSIGRRQVGPLFFLVSRNPSLFRQPGPAPNPLEFSPGTYSTTHFRSLFLTLGNPTKTSCSAFFRRLLRHTLWDQIRNFRSTSTRVPTFRFHTHTLARRFNTILPFLDFAIFSLSSSGGTTFLYLSRRPRGNRILLRSRPRTSHRFH